MKVKDLKPGQLATEMKKNIRVQALGDFDIYVGYYNHLRRRGGDVFVLRPVIRKRQYVIGTEVDSTTGKQTKKFKTEETLITAEMQFSDRWMKKVTKNVPETKPKHFNEIGRGKKRLDIPGMTNKIGGENDNVLNENESPVEADPEFSTQNDTVTDEAVI